jgi:DNA polymerase III subunit epsilon
VNTLGGLRLAWARRSCKLPVQQRLLEQALPTHRAFITDIELVALDFETTGLDFKRDHIIAAGWILVRGDRILMGSAREIRVRDDTSEGVGQSAVIHGILDSDLNDAEDSESLLEKLLPDLNGRAIIAHAATIERTFLNALLRTMGGTAILNPFIDTMRLERLLIEGSGGNVRDSSGELTLAACRARHGLPEHQQHSAAADAVAAAELFLAQLAYLGGAEKVRLRDLR